MTAVLNALRLGSKPIRAIDPPVFIVGILWVPLALGLSKYPKNTDKYIIEELIKIYNAVNLIINILFLY